MENKICVYAIAKNEENFVDRWYESMREADYIVVLDTGSTDCTIEKLKSYGVFVKQKKINPWRFDIARNESMKLIPDDANILVCVDLDEVFEAGWANILREKWDENNHVRCYYKYAWSHDENNNPLRIFWYDKIHSRNWYWKYPVHETLVSDKYNDKFIDNHVLNLFEEVYLHHYPDRTKSRGSYLPLLELRKKENPNDYDGLFYLSHEYYYRGYYKESIKELKYILKNYRNVFDSVYLSACYMFLGDNYRALEDYKRAITSYNLAIIEDKTLREPYLYMAECYNHLEMYENAIGAIKQAFCNSYRHYTWVERDRSWQDQAYDILAISYYYLNNIDYSYINCLKAYHLNPNDERISNNKKLIETAFFNNI